MMTEIETIEGGQKDVSSLEGTTLKKLLFANTFLWIILKFFLYFKGICVCVCVCQIQVK